MYLCLNPHYKSVRTAYCFRKNSVIGIRAVTGSTGFTTNLRGSVTTRQPYTHPQQSSAFLATHVSMLSLTRTHTYIEEQKKKHVLLELNFSNKLVHSNLSGENKLTLWIVFLSHFMLSNLFKNSLQSSFLLLFSPPLHFSLPGRGAVWSCQTLLMYLKSKWCRLCDLSSAGVGIYYCHGRSSLTGYETGRAGKALKYQSTSVE